MVETAFPPGLPIGEVWTPTTEHTTIRFPYDGSPVAEAPVGTPEHALSAIAAADACADTLASAPTRARYDTLIATRDALAALAEEFVDLLVLETGKPLRDCRVEVNRTLLTLRTAAEEAVRVHGETVPLDLLPSGDGLIGFWQRVPIGVVVGITGFNYPLLLAAHKFASALAAGCPIIGKPAPATPLATLWLVHLLREAAVSAGLPAAVAQLVTGDVEVGSTLVTDDRVAAVSFTGSAQVGHRIARDAAPRKVLLELGSNAALVVAADADLDRAADAVVRGAYYASGQACISVQRVLVEKPVAKEFTALVLDRARKVVVGDPRRPETEVAPLIDERSTRRVREWVDDAVAHGAHPLLDGPPEGRAIAPVVLTYTSPGMAVWDEEVFGPVLCLRAVPDLDTALTMVNRSRYGLHASVWTASLDTALRAIDRLKVGGVIVNEVPGFRSDTMPYGGVKDSGIGREGPRFAVEELTVTKMAVIRRG